MSSERIDGLDAIRGICAIAVAGMHSRFLTHVDPFPSAYLMVDIFFAMSGFVIAMIYGDRLRSGGYFLKFVERRWTRLLPMWALGLAIGVIVEIMFHHQWPAILKALASFALGMMFLPAPIAAFLFPFNPPGWSLFFEAIANLAYGLGARLLSRNALIALVAISAAVLVSLIARFGSADGGGIWATASLGLVRTIFSFSVGLLIYDMRARVPLPSVSAPFFWIVMAAMVLVAATNIRGVSRTLFDILFILVGCPAILLVGIRGTVGLPRLARFLGDLSYPLYAIHFAAMIAVFYLHGAVVRWRSDHISVVSGMLFVLSLIAICYGFARLIDRRAETGLRRLLDRNPAHLTS